MTIITGGKASEKRKLVELLTAKYEYRELKIYTNRPKRENETNKNEFVFVSSGEFERLSKRGRMFLCTWTETEGENVYKYGLSKNVISDKGILVRGVPADMKDFSDCPNRFVAVLPLEVIESLKKKGGSYSICSILLKVDDESRAKRLLDYGYSFDEVYNIIKSDRETFSNIKSGVIDYVIENFKYKHSLKSIANALSA